MSAKTPKSSAGGWGALLSSAKHIKQTQNIGTCTKSLLALNQPTGFDCPGCAWPNPSAKDRSSFEFCENGVKAIAAETTGKRVDADFFATHTVAHLSDQSDYWLESQGRITQPMQYDAASDRYLPVSWSDAFSTIGQQLKALQNPNEAIFYTSGRTSNEAAFLYQLFGRMYGTNNFPDCSNMCHESSGLALGETIGIGKGTVTLKDFDHADLILVIGQNPGTNHPRMLSELQKANHRGATIVSINPLKEAGLLNFTHPQHIGDMLSNTSNPISSHYYQPLIAGDLALFTGVIKAFFERHADRLDTDFIERHTEGFIALKENIQEQSWDCLAEESGLSRQAMTEIADLYAQSKRVIACWAMGLTQQKHAVAAIQMVVNLMLLGGNIGRQGAGLCPVRGHSNVQGDRTMGIIECPTEAFLDALDSRFSFTAPRSHGFDVVAAIEAMHDNNAKVFIGMGGNFAAATPDTDFTHDALRACELTVHISTKLNRSHLVHGKDAFILPCLGRSERDDQGGHSQFITVEDSMSMVHRSQGTLSPPSSQLMSEPAIVIELAKATLAQSDMDWDSCYDYRTIREHIAAVIPGFHDFESRLQSPDGFYLGNSAREHEWKTPTQKANFTVQAVEPINLPQHHLRLMTMRSHDQYNTTIYGLDDRYRGIHGIRRVIFLNAEDMAEQGIQLGDKVNIVSTDVLGNERRADNFVAVLYDIPKGCAASYFPETNSLVPIHSHAIKSRTPLSKFIPITLETLP